MEIRWGIIAVASFAMLGVCADEGPTFEANVWRGETAYVSIPAKFAGEMLPCDGVAKDGICLELFGLRGVDFRTSAKSDIMARRLDVVEYRSIIATTTTPLKTDPSTGVIR